MLLISTKPNLPNTAAAVLLAAYPLLRLLG